MKHLKRSRRSIENGFFILWIALCSTTITYAAASSEPSYQGDQQLSGPTVEKWLSHQLSEALYIAAVMTDSSTQARIESGDPKQLFFINRNFRHIEFGDLTPAASYHSQFMFGLHLGQVFGIQSAEGLPRVGVVLSPETWVQPTNRELKVEVLIQILDRLRLQHSLATLGLYEQMLAAKSSPVYQLDFLKTEEAVLKELKSTKTDTESLRALDHWLTITQAQISQVESLAIKQIADKKKTGDHVIETRVLKELIANDDRVGTADYLRQKLPWGLMTPAAHAIWSDYLEAVVEPKDEYRVLLFRGDRGDEHFIEKQNHSLLDKLYGMLPSSPTGQLPRFYGNSTTEGAIDLLDKAFFTTDNLKHETGSLGQGRLTNSLLSQMGLHAKDNYFGSANSPLLSLSRSADRARTFAVDLVTKKPGRLRAFAVDKRLLLPASLQGFTYTEQAYETFMLFPSDHIATINLSPSDRDTEDRRGPRMASGNPYYRPINLVKTMHFELLAQRTFAELYGERDWARHNYNLDQYLDSTQALKEFFRKTIKFEPTLEVQGQCKDILASTP